MEVFIGFGATVGREVPFAMIQMPSIGEAAAGYRGCTNRTTSPYAAARRRLRRGRDDALDVVKTRLMLGADAKGVASPAADVFRASCGRRARPL